MWHLASVKSSESGCVIKNVKLQKESYHFKQMAKQVEHSTNKELHYYVI